MYDLFASNNSIVWASIIFAAGSRLGRVDLNGLRKRRPPLLHSPPPPPPPIYASSRPYPTQSTSHFNFPHDLWIENLLDLVVPSIPQGVVMAVLHFPAILMVRLRERHKELRVNSSSGLYASFPSSTTPRILKGSICFHGELLWRTCGLNVFTQKPYLIPYCQMRRGPACQSWSSLYSSWVASFPLERV